MIKIMAAFMATFLVFQVEATPYRQLKMYEQKSFKTDNDKIKSCLAGLYQQQIQFRKAKGYFATLPNELHLNKYKICDGLEISTHFVSDNGFKMTAKFNQKVWSVDQTKIIRQIR